MQPGPDSIGIVAISHGCTGVAARACGLVGLEPTRVSPAHLGYECCDSSMSFFFFLQMFNQSIMSSAGRRNPQRSAFMVP